MDIIGGETEEIDLGDTEKKRQRGTDRREEREDRRWSSGRHKRRVGTGEREGKDKGGYEGEGRGEGNVGEDTKVEREREIGDRGKREGREREERGKRGGEGREKGEKGRER
jgi:hypothetical protein